MSIQKPVWTEGLFVAEHHLQQQDRYHEGLLDHRVSMAMAPGWGLTELEIDVDALKQGQFVLKSLRGVFPDGTIVQCGGGGGPVPGSRGVQEKFGPSLDVLPVYVACAEESEARGNLGAEGASTGRFVAESRAVADLNAGGRPMELPWARPAVRVLLGDEPREGQSTIQVAELLRTQAGAFLMRDTFVPPVLQTGASPFLAGGLRRVANALSGRGREIAGTRRQRSDSHVEFDAADASKMLLLAVINRSIPLVSHLSVSPTLSPELAYRTLVQLAGELCTFVPEADPTTLPKYNYLSLGDTFEPLLARVLALINTTVEERFIQIPLQRRDDGMYLGQFDDPNLLEHELFVAAHGSMSDSEIHQQLPKKLSKIASWNAIGPLLNQAVNGARIELEFRPPAALPIRPGVSFFRIQRTAEFWPDIAGTASIAIYHPLPKEAVELSLYAVARENL